MKHCGLLLILITLVIGVRAQNVIGIFNASTDVGKPKNAGSTVFEPSEQVYTLKGSGYNIWFGRDEFQYAFQKLSGDFILTGNFEFVSGGIDPHRKVGWMIRESLDDDAAHISSTLHGDGLTVLQWRTLKGAHMRDLQDEIFAPKKNYQI